MNQIQAIRRNLGMTQRELAQALGCTQGNVGHYERGQTVPPKVAMRLIDVSKNHGLVISLDHVYALKDVPEKAESSVTRSFSATDSAAQGVVHG